MPSVRVGSQQIFYDECGAGRPVLLIPGLGHSRFSWWKQFAPFSQYYRVISMDNRDAGDSAPAVTPYTLREMSEDAAGLIERLDNGPMHLLGWSMGGYIALELTLAHPGLVGKLILVATSAGGLAHVPPAPEIESLLTPGRNENIEKRARRIYPLIAVPGYMRSHPEDLEEVVHYAKRNRMRLISYQRQFKAVRRWGGVSERLGRIATPTLVVHGEADPLIPWVNGQYLSLHIRGAKLLTYPGVGHLIPIEAPERFNEDVRAFLG